MPRRANASPRLIATDLDGTLLTPEATVSPRTHAALEACWRLGIVTLFVTARPPRWLGESIDSVGGHGLAICANGAFLYDVAARRVIREDSLSPTDVRRLSRRLRAAIPDVALHFETAAGHLADPTSPNIPDHVQTCSPEDLRIPVGKIVARCPRMDDAKFLSIVEAVIGGDARLSYSGSSHLAEIGALHVTKANALAEFCRERAIDAHDVWAFGDMPNDIPMLTWAGRSFAVANAHPDVLNFATDQCPSNSEDGVAQVLESLVCR